MLVGRRVRPGGPRGPPTPNTDSSGERGELARLAARRAGPRLRPLRLLAGFRHRRLRHHRPAARRPARRLARADRARRRRPVAAGLARRAVHRDPRRRRWARACSSSSAPGSATGSPGSRSRAIDAVGGAALSAAAVLVVAWALGVAISGLPDRRVTRPVRSSAVLGQVNEVMPEAAGQLLDAFNDVVGTRFFPRYLEPFSPERIVEVEPRRRADAARPRRRARRRAACSRSAAPTTAAAASRAPGSSTPRTG